MFEVYKKKKNKMVMLYSIFSCFHGTPLNPLHLMKRALLACMLFPKVQSMTFYLLDAFYLSDVEILIMLPSFYFRIQTQNELSSKVQFVS